MFDSLKIGFAAVAMLGVAQAQPVARPAPVRSPAHEDVVVQGTTPLQQALSQVGEAKAPTGTLSYPYGVSVDSNSNVYVTNLFGGVNVYNPTNKYKLSGSISVGVSSPTAVAISFGGTIYVANNSGLNISIYDGAYNNIGSITDPALGNPVSMSIDADDTLWVLDAQGVLHSYLSNGTIVTPETVGGTSVAPWGPYVTVWGISRNGSYDEEYGGRAQSVHDGIFLYGDYSAGSPKTGAVAQDQYGQQYVTDIANNVVQVWNKQGSFKVGTFSTPAQGFGIAVDTKLNRVYVAYTSLNEVYVYSTAPGYKLISVIH